MKQQLIPSSEIAKVMMSCQNCSCDKKKDCCKKYKKKGVHCKKCPKL